MVPGKKLPKWDIYEAVILLDGCLDVQRANQPKMQIVKRVSEDLRRMAVNRGIGIDNIYRNEMVFRTRSRPWIPHTKARSTAQIPRDIVISVLYALNSLCVYLS